MIEINNQNENFPEANQIQETVLSINDIEENRDNIRNTFELYSVINPIIAIPINPDLSPEIISEYIFPERNQLYQYCILIPIGLLGITLLFYYNFLK
jgi:hypothetical protein